MSISSLRWRVTLALGAAVAAVFALAVPAGASAGSRAGISPEQAGYIASGAQFKAISAIVYLRNPTQYAGEVAGYRHSVQLWTWDDAVVTFGVRASTSGTRYTPYATIYDRSTHQVIASNPNAWWRNVTNERHPGFRSAEFGRNCFLSISYTPATGHLTMYGAFGYGPDFQLTYTVIPQSFIRARVGTEFGSSPWDSSYSYTPPATSVKVAAYQEVELTNYRGRTATLWWSWWNHAKLIAQPSGSDVVAVPHDLSNGGASFQTWFVPKSAQ